MPKPVARQELDGLLHAPGGGDGEGGTGAAHGAQGEGDPPLAGGAAPKLC